MRLRFDRGTVVLDEVDSGVDPQSLVEVTWDLELSAWRAPASSHALVRGRLSDGGVRVADDVEPPPRVDGVRVPELRWYQREAVDEWRASGDRGVVALPTGSGKTIVAIAAIAALETATLVLVPTRVLLDQWARAIAASWPHPVGKLGDGDHSIRPITIATYASAIAWAPRIGDRFGLVVVDEAHHVGAWCPVDMLEMLVAPARLGLTATPPGPGPIARHVGPIVYTLSIADLVGDGLAAHDLVQVRVGLTADERACYDRERRTFATAYAAFARRQPGATWKQFVDAASRNDSGRAAVAAWKASRAVIAYPSAKRDALRKLLATHAGERTLVFTGDNATAYAIARELLVMPITHEIGRAERVAMLERFRTGEVPVLVSSQVLDEGLDVPDAEVAIVVGGTASARRHVQRIGRVLRPRPGKRARIYEMAVQSTVEVDQVLSRRAGVAS
jgi:superfamily II DNA or RNA helicase